MSYTLNIIGFGVQESFKTELDLKSALSKAGARFQNYGFGDFLYELAGLSYRESPEGIYTWLIYTSDGKGLLPADVGACELSPRQDVYVLYKFIPRSQSGGYIFEPLSRRSFEEPITYSPSLQEYSIPEPEVPEYVLVDEEEREEGYRKLPERVKVEYSPARLTSPVEELQTYRLVLPRRSVAPRLFIAEREDTSELERFLLETLQLRPVLLAEAPKLF